MFSDIKNFYPTPPHLISKMLSRVNWRNVSTILEPSAGKGNILDALRERGRTDNPAMLSAIELNPELQATLRGKGYRVIDSDFMTYNGLEQFDLIIANPPFDCGDSHLLKMIDIMFNGQIVCVLNAETLKNQYSNTRKRLAQTLEKLGATIEYLQESFLDAERVTNVEVALIYIQKFGEVEKDIFGQMEEDVHSGEFEDIQERYDIATTNTIGAIVKQYNRDKDAAMSQLMGFYKNYKAVKKYLNIRVAGENEDKAYKIYEREPDDLTTQMKKRVNALSTIIKHDYWMQTIKLEEVNSWLTSKKRDAIMSDLKSFATMEFTESNIRQLILNLIDKFPKMINEAIEYLFDSFTKHALSAKEHKDLYSDYLNNIHYFSGWRTNNAYKINKRVIMPFYRSDWEVRGNSISWEQEKLLDDVDMVMNYFSGKRHYAPSKDKQGIGANEYIPTKTLVKNALSVGENRKVDTEYFYISIYKKGTIHFEFKDMDLLRRFNIAACQGKNFLPHDYSSKAYKDMTSEEKDIVEQFDGGEKGYKQTKIIKAIGVDAVTDPRFLIAS